MRKSIILLLTLLAGVVIGITIDRLGASDRVDPHAQAAAVDTHEGHGHGSDTEPTAAHMADWCAEHRVPESECTLCHPELIESFKTSGNWCGGHNLPESHCRKCNPYLSFPQEPKEVVTAEPVTASVFYPPNDGGCHSDEAVIRFASVETPRRIGLTVEPVAPTTVSALVDAPAELVFDQTATVVLTTSVPATVVRWLVEPGQTVGDGTALVELESPDIAQLKSDCLEAHTDWGLESRKLGRASELSRRGLISSLELEDAQAGETAALSRLEGLKARLSAIGLTDEAIDGITAAADVSPRWTVHATHSSAVLERRAPLGELLPAGSTLALLGDPNALWIEAHVREQDLDRFRVGQEVTFTSDGLQMSRTEGRVIWISQYLEADSRTAIVRARVVDPGRDLQANRFGRLQLPSETNQAVLTVPKDAVQWEGCCNIVFVQEAEDRYRPRKVTLGRGDGRRYAVTSGLSEGDLVVTSGSFLLKTELKKESLGVGCAGE